MSEVSSGSLRLSDNAFQTDGLATEVHDLELTDSFRCCCSVKVDPADADNFPKMIELWFLFSMIWSICCSVDEEGRKQIDAYLREIDGSFPNKDSIYEYYVEPKTRSWIHWEEKLKQGWKLNPRFNCRVFFHLSSFNSHRHALCFCGVVIHMITCEWMSMFLIT